MLLTIEGCRGRGDRLVRWMSEEKIDLAVITDPKHVYYFTRALETLWFPSVAIITAEGHVTVVDCQERELAADRVVVYEPQKLCTIRPDLPGIAAELVGHELADGNPASAAIEYGSCWPYVRDHLDCPVRPLDERILRMRRRKDPDELAVIRRLHEIGDAGYATAKAMMTPGNDELEIYNAVRASMALAAGEDVTVVGADFACAEPGGPPRQGRKTADGELNIFDMGPGHWGYAVDTCRTFAVGGNPTDEQLRAWETVVEALGRVERMVRPGVKCAEVYREIKAFLDGYAPDSFFHHLGHGVGLRAHEGPRLNPHYDDTFAEGDVFAAEPGLYSPALRAGIRLEHNYLCTADGVEKLTPFPLDLT